MYDSDSELNRIKYYKDFYYNGSNTDNVHALVHNIKS